MVENIEKVMLRAEVGFLTCDICVRALHLT